MIVKIEPPNAGIIAAVRYNENKMNGIDGPRPENSEDLEVIENGHVVATRNVPEGSSLMDEFERLRLLSIKKRHTGPVIQNTAFHMSVNPASGDKKLSEEEAVRLIDEIMESLGYGSQPYRIYKHTDIPRQHYHVVSCRAGQDGKKIEDSFERMKLRRTLKSLSDKYGFDIVLNEYEKEKETADNKKEHTKTKQEKDGQKTTNPKKDNAKRAIREPKTDKITFVPSFSRKSATPVSVQIRNIVDDALKWHFTTFEQLQILLRKRYNVSIELENSTEDGRIVLSGTKPSGETATPLMYEEDLGIQLLQKIKEKTENEKMSSKKQQRERLEGLVKAAAASAATYKDFQTLLEKKGVWIALSWKTAEDDIFGVTYLDRATKCAWKGSETAIDLQWLKQTVAAKGWTIEKDPSLELMRKRNDMPSRRKTIGKKTENTPFNRPSGPTPGRSKRFQAGHQQGSNADVNKNHDDLLDSNKKDNKPKEYIGE